MAFFDKNLRLIDEVVDFARAGPLLRFVGSTSNVRAIKSLLFNERSSTRIGEIGWKIGDPKSSICYSRLSVSIPDTHGVDCVLQGTDDR